ncbi:ABC-2 type transporter [Rhizobium sp. CF080]|uniref:ABC transporter permease n=1 Tax=Rhizobium sp. (strain CF080) TaxID=1144310 RepID=UPI000271A2EC|nr:ABC transporter permease [Rhizobium sp. CF080]EUB96530.1 ABC-2 type transporter [Rhizobium sp. CF080]
MYHFQTHFRVVTALIVREMSARFGNKPGGYIWALLEPMAYIAFMTVLFGAISHTPALGTSFPMFFATGYISYQFYSGTVAYTMRAVAFNRNMLQYPNVAPFDTVVARFILQSLTMAVVAIFVLGLIEEVSFSMVWVDAQVVIDAAAVASLLALGMAMTNNVLFARYPLYEKIYGIFTRPLFMLTGIFYLPEMIPSPFRDILLLNPLVHVVMKFRTGFYPEYRALDLDMNYACTFALVVFTFGFTTFTLGRKTLRGR